MTLQITGREVCDARSFSGNLAGFSGIFAAYRVREQGRARFFACSKVSSGPCQPIARPFDAPSAKICENERIIARRLCGTPLKLNSLK
jgi:hypothetical protein